MGFGIGFLWFIYVVVCFLLMFIVLIQRGETGGLSSAFGGGGGETAFGVKADVTWKKATAWFAGTFMFLAIVLGALMARQSNMSLAATGGAAPAGATGASGGAEAGAQTPTGTAK
jgi:preprotein translocase subunit SecG